MNETRLGLYVHWPYCTAICPYCDFNVYGARNADPDALTKTLLDDLAAWRTRIENPRPLASMHFGGGTPSLMPPGAVAKLLERAEALFGFESTPEIALEANPEDAECFAALKDAGIERLSIGVQSFSDEGLAALGRRHGGDQARRAVETALAIFPRVSLDLIHGWRGQTPEGWARELEEAAALRPGHVSLYALTLEPGTPFAKRAARGERLTPSEDGAAALFDIAQAWAAQAGYDAYEVSNHARETSQRSRHNQLYWRSENWIGIGPGAHGRVTIDGARAATETVRRPGAYIDAAGKAAITPLAPRDQALEALLMGLRLAEGVSLAKLERLSGAALNARILHRLRGEDLLTDDQTQIQATARGRRLLDALASELADAIS